jgi:hypothetical protein
MTKKLTAVFTFIFALLAIRYEFENIFLMTLFGCLMALCGFYTLIADDIKRNKEID